MLEIEVSFDPENYDMKIYGSGIIAWESDFKDSQ